MEKKIYVISKINLWLFLLIFIISSYSQMITLRYFASFITFIIFTLLIYASGLITNKQSIYKKNINIYMGMYFILLICLTMFIGRSGFGLINKEYFEFYIKSINLIPFKTILGYLSGYSNIGIVFYNIIGNFIALIPLSLLLILKNDKYKNWKNQIIFLGITVFSIEMLQLLLSAGRFDIDDFILNLSGSLLFFGLIKKLNLDNHIKNMFYSNFNLKTSIKYLIYAVIFSMTIIINVVLIFELYQGYINQKNYYHQIFYVETIDNCSNMKKIETDEFNIYLNCVNPIYENEDGEQMPMAEAFTQKHLTRDDVKEKLTRVNYYFDGGTATYISEKDNLFIVLCNTINGNKDIYIGSQNMKFKANFCKDDNSTFTRTYTINSIEEYKEQQYEAGTPVIYTNSFKVSLSQYQGEMKTIIINNIFDDLKINQTYEFEFMTDKKNITDNIESIFKNSTIVEIRATNKRASDQIQDSIR